MKHLLCLVFAVLCQGQSNTVTLSGPTTIGNGQNTITASIAGPNQPAGFQWRQTFPASVTAFSASPGPAATAAGKNITCGALVAASAICVVVGQNNNRINAGVIASFVVTANNPTGSQVFTPSQPIGGAPNGDRITYVAGPALSIPATPPVPTVVPCDVTRNGTVGPEDTAAILSVLVGGTAPTGSVTDQDNKGTTDVIDYLIVNTKLLGGTCLGR